VRNSEPFTYFEESLPEALSRVRAVHLSKPKQCALKLPLPIWLLFDPVTGDRKVCVGIGGLPGIASERHLTSRIFTLQIMSGFYRIINAWAYGKALLKFCHLNLEHVDDCGTSSLAIWKQDSGCCACSDINHVLELRMLKSRNRLER
jgi:hypothetical protein